MNSLFKHDYTYCKDYEKDKCPKNCLRAEITQELKEEMENLDKDSYPLIISWAHFKGTEDCKFFKK